VFGIFSTVYSTVGKILPQKCAILCNAPQMMDCRNAYFRKGTQHRERVRNSLVLNYKSAAPVRLSYNAYVTYVILGDVLTFVLTPVGHRSPLECRLPMKNRQWRKAWDLSDVLPFGRLWYAEGDRECNRLREVLGRNCEGKKHAVRA
jgi:hypothetical protein